MSDSSFESHERVVALTRRHWIGLWSTLVWASLIGALAEVAAFLAPSSLRSAPYFGKALFVLGAVVWLALSGPTLAEWASTVYVITPRRILMRRGLIRRQQTEVGLDQVCRCSIRQGILGRALGYGTVRVELRNGSWWTMRRLARPRALVESIGEAGRESRSRSGIQG